MDHPLYDHQQDAVPLRNGARPIPRPPRPVGKSKRSNARNVGLPWLGSRIIERIPHAFVATWISRLMLVATLVGIDISVVRYFGSTPNLDNPLLIAMPAAGLACSMIALCWQLGWRKAAARTALAAICLGLVNMAFIMIGTRHAPGGTAIEATMIGLFAAIALVSFPMLSLD